MAKRSKAAELKYKQARALIDILLADKDLKIHMDARHGAGFMPGKGAFDAIDLRACKKNQEYLRGMVADLVLVCESIDAMPKQGDMVDNMDEKEARLKEELLGSPEPLGPTPEREAG